MLDLVLMNVIQLFGLISLKQVSETVERDQRRFTKRLPGFNQTRSLFVARIADRAASQQLSIISDCCFFLLGPLGSRS